MESCNNIDQLIHVSFSLLRLGKKSVVDESLVKNMSCVQNCKFTTQTLKRYLSLVSIFCGLFRTSNLLKGFSKILISDWSVVQKMSADINKRISQKPEFCSLSSSFSFILSCWFFGTIYVVWQAFFSSSNFCLDFFSGKHN